MTLVISKLARAGRIASAAAVAAMLAVPTAAQTVNDSDTPAANLDLPKNLQIFGKADPNIRKPTAIVNDVVITGTDVDQRMAMVIALQRLQLKPEEHDQLRLQVLRQLIDETIEIQQAKSNDISVTDDQVNQSYSRVARNYNRTAEQFSAYLRQVGSSDRSMKRQIEGELAWNRYLQKEVEWRVNVSDEEVRSILDNLERAKGTVEYHLKEVFLRSTPETSQQVAANAQKMIEQMRSGTPFEYFATNFSEASTRAVGGDLDWVRLTALPTELAQAAQQMQIGQVAGPIENSGGFSLLYLADKRQVLTSDPRDAKLSLRQLTLKFPPGFTKAQATDRAAEFAKQTAAIRGCGDVPKTAQALGAEMIDNDSVRIRDIASQSPQLADIMLKLQVGQSTPPFGSVEDGIRVLVLCSRDDPPPANLPSAERVRSQIEEQRVNLRADRMLRDLRRDALVEYR